MLRGSSKSDGHDRHAHSVGPGLQQAANVARVARDDHRRDSGESLSDHDRVNRIIAATRPQEFPGPTCGLLRGWKERVDLVHHTIDVGAIAAATMNRSQDRGRDDDHVSPGTCPLKRGARIAIATRKRQDSAGVENDSGR